MANGHGGYREPTNPAPVSGPGALSQRTDGQMKGPVPSAEGLGGMAGGGMGAGPDLSSLVPFGAPTNNPDEPITAGAPGGPGPGPSLGPGGMTEKTASRLRSYLPVFVLLASSPDADPATKQYVRQLRGELG
jgi:hypothetical protein